MYQELGEANNFIPVNTIFDAIYSEGVYEIPDGRIFKFKQEICKVLNLILLGQFHQMRT